jgi:hypothetical protein
VTTVRSRTLQRSSPRVGGSTPAISLHNLVFPEQGEYRFQLWNQDSLLGERRYTVRMAQPA